MNRTPPKFIPTPRTIKQSVYLFVFLSFSSFYPLPPPYFYLEEHSQMKSIPPITIPTPRTTKAVKQLSRPKANPV